MTFIYIREMLNVATVAMFNTQNIATLWFGMGALYNRRRARQECRGRMPQAYTIAAPLNTGSAVRPRLPPLPHV